MTHLHPTEQRPCLTARAAFRLCSLRMRWYRLFIGCLGALLLGVPPVSAQAVADATSSALTLRGFGTLGMARSDTDQAEFVRDLSQPGGVARRWSAKVDSLAGVQDNYQAAEQIEAVAQVVSRYRNDGSFKPQLMWAFMIFDPNTALSLREGRLGTEFYMQADSRLVGYSYLTVRPPGDYFGALPFSFIDGADVAMTAPLAGGVVRGKLFSGLTREKAPLASRQWDLNGSIMSGGYLDYHQGRWQTRLGYSRLRFKHDLPLSDLHAGLIGAGAQVASDQLRVDGKAAHFYSAGLAYDEGPFQAQLMLSRIRQESAIFENARTGYLIAGYRVQTLTPFAGYSWVKSSAKTASTGNPALDAGIASTINPVMADSHSDQHTVILGSRWDFRRNMAVKAQLDIIRGTPQSIFPYRAEKAGFDGKLNVLSLNLDFVF